MKMNGKWIKTGSILSILLLVISALYLYSRDIDPKSNVYADSSQDLSLTPPTLLATTAATYLEQEAGIAIYIQTTGPLNLNTAKSLMDVENATSDYVIGSLKPPLNPPFFTSDDYPHCFVHKDGWIVVYYLKPTTENKAWLGRTIDWSDTNPLSDPITSNLLYDGLSYIATPLGKQADLTNAKYYHFQYPTATKLLFALKHAPNGQTKTFIVTIPFNCTIRERSWSCYNGPYGTHTFNIGPNQISQGSDRKYGGPEITENILPNNDVAYTVSISASSNMLGNNAYVCLILLYS